MKLGELIQQYREQNDLSQRQFATVCGLSNGFISMIEKNINPNTGAPIVPSLKNYKQIANGMKISVAELFSQIDDAPVNLVDDDIFQYDNIMPIEKKKFPLLGNIACGEPIFADEEHDLYIEAGADIRADFCLRAKGESMIGIRIFDGDIVFIRKQDIVDNGEVAAVLIEDEVTLKRVYYDRNANELSLVAENPTFKTMRFYGEELNQIKILGKAVAFQSDIK